MNNQIPFNKPFLTGKETEYIEDAVMLGKISGNGDFTKKCHAFFRERYNFPKTLLTTSCTDALEMSAILVDIQAGDEVIMPAYTFVSTANAFILRGANIRFVDSREDHPGMDENLIEALITPKTKAIVLVHYAGISCDMQKVLDIAKKHDLSVIEDAAQAIESYYTFPDGTKKPLGSIGHLACFSFHETKNIISGEGGMLVVNDDELKSRAEIIWEKGTNRSAFFRGEVDKYGWKDIGSSFLPSELTAAFLFAQLENIEKIQNRRKLIWQRYYGALSERVAELNIQKPFVPEYSTNNAHMFYLVTESYEQRKELLSYLKEKKILAVFHYLSLHKSDFFEGKHDGRDLPLSDKYSDRLLRLPLYYDLTDAQQNYIIRNIKRFVEEKISDKYFLQSA